MSDEILIDPFAMIPCDCYVTSGTSQVNESIVTGESVHIPKTVGDFLLAGTRNGSGVLTAVVYKEQHDSTLAHLIDSISEATTAKASIQQHIERITHYFVLSVILLTILGPSFVFYRMDSNQPCLQRLHYCSERGMAILAAACPCPLGLATPSAIMAGIGKN